MASAAGGAIQTAAQTAAPSIAAGADPFAAVERSMRGAAGGNDPAALHDGAVAAMSAAVTGDQQQAAAARDRAAEALAKARDLPIEQARTQVTQYERQYRNGVETALVAILIEDDRSARRAAMLRGLSLKSRSTAFKLRMTRN